MIQDYAEPGGSWNCAKLCPWHFPANPSPFPRHNPVLGIKPVVLTRYAGIWWSATFIHTRC